MTNVVLFRRFSTDEQEGGDSLSRQARVCEAFAAARGWTITERLTDKGRSAYKGEHLLPEAELGGWIARLERGEVQEGTILLAERLDRLSRRPVAEALAWLFGLTVKGIQIAIADKGKVFTSEMTLEDILTSALSLDQSNEESAKKSERITSAKHRLWGMAERREGAWTNLSAHPPSWLERTPNRDGWTVIEERAAILRDLYQWSADGLGAVTIASRLNAEGVQPWGPWRKTPGWSRTSIRQILVNPAVEGDLVPETGMFKGRVLHGFFPRIVDADIVAKARGQQESRRKLAGKATSSGTGNLFAGLTVCGECGARAFTTVSKNRFGVSYTYLRCTKASEGRCSNRGFYAYEPFENAVLDLCLDLALDDRFFAASGELREAQIWHAETEKAIASKRAARERLLSFLEGDDDPQVVARLRRTRDELADLNAQLETAKADVERCSGRVGAEEHLRRVQDIRAAAESDHEHTRRHARAKLRQAFSSIMNSVALDMFEGQKTLTVAFLGGILALRFDAKGALIDRIEEAVHKPLADALTPEQQAVVEPLLRRMTALAA